MKYLSFVSGFFVTFGTLNSSPMKKLILTFCFLFVIFFLQAQYIFDWSEPQIVTDTNSVYANPFVTVIGNTSLLFYEKHEIASSISRMDLNNLEDNIVLLSSNTFSYTLPVYYSIYNSGSPGRLFYLSDEDGAYNLYAASLFANDSLGEAIKVVPNIGNGNILDYSLNFNGQIAYTIDSMVYAADLKFLSDTVYTENNALLDSASFNIRVMLSIASWQRMEEDSSYIINSHRTYNNGVHYWDTPFYADSTGDCRWLTSTTLSELTFNSLYCWEKGDTVKGIYGKNYLYLDTIIINTYSKSNVRQLSIINWYIGEKNLFYDPYYMCFATGLGDSSEIFCSQNNFGNEGGVYISNNNYPDDNPKVFFGNEKESYPSGWTMWVYCIWQTHINGNVALSMSKNIADFTYSVNENYDVDNYLKVSPNPFSDKLYISVNTNGETGNIIIFNQNGQQINFFSKLNSGNDWQTINWQTTTHLSKGVYLIVLNINGKEFVRKVILQ